MKMTQLYNSLHEDYVITTVSGPMRYIKWLESEKVRIESSGDRVAEVRRSPKAYERVSLWVDDKSVKDMHHLYHPLVRR